MTKLIRMWLCNTCQWNPLSAAASELDVAKTCSTESRPACAKSLASLEVLLINPGTEQQGSFSPWNSKLAKVCGNSLNVNVRKPTKPLQPGQVPCFTRVRMLHDIGNPEYLSVFQKCCRDLKLQLVPYQARHSGPSIDRASGDLSQEDVPKRGGWLSRQSVARYEKAGRLKLSSEVQLTCVMAEKYIEEIILGQSYPVITIPG